MKDGRPERDCTEEWTELMHALDGLVAVEDAEGLDLEKMVAAILRVSLAHREWRGLLATYDAYIRRSLQGQDGRVH